LRKIFGMTVILSIFSNITDIVIIERMNLLLHIPDSVLYLFGDAVLADIVGMIQTVSGVILIAKLCVKGTEGTTFAFLVSLHNSGVDVSGAIALYLQKVFNVELSMEEGFECRYENLTLLMVIGGILLPLILIPLTFILIPVATMDNIQELADNRPQYERLVKDNNEDIVDKQLVENNRQQYESLVLSNVKATGISKSSIKLEDLTNVKETESSRSSIELEKIYT